MLHFATNNIGRGNQSRPHEAECRCIKAVHPLGFFFAGKALWLKGLEGGAWDQSLGSFITRITKIRNHIPGPQIDTVGQSEGR